MLYRLRSMPTEWVPLRRGEVSGNEDSCAEVWRQLTGHLRDAAEALQRVSETVEAGLSPVVVVSAMGRQGDPYATDTLLNFIYHTNPEPDEANIDLLLSCGEIISASIFAEGLRKMRLPAAALTGWQCGIITDDVHLGARVTSVRAERLRELLEAGIVPVVAGFQGVTAGGKVTTLGRGGAIPLLQCLEWPSRRSRLRFSQMLTESRPQTPGLFLMHLP